MQDQLEKLEQRVGTLEAWARQQQIDSAIAQERHQSLVKRLDKIDAHINKLIWIILAAVLGGVMTFIMRGGLSVVGG